MSQYDPIIAGSLDIAQTEALQRRHTQLEPAHLLWGIVNNPRATAAKSLAGARRTLKDQLEKLPSFDKKTFRPEDLRASATLSQWITKASARAIQNGRQEVGEADLLAYLKDYFSDLDLDPSIFDQGDAPEVPKFLTNLNELAGKGKLDPVIGRSREIRAVMEILGRRGKNNPVLVGEAGVGKTAVVEGLADLIVKGKVPDALKDKTVYSLDMGALMAGTKYRGEFEERMQQLVAFVKESAGQIVLFIDEIHQLVGAGRTDGAMDAANLLKPALARGELHCIGATTHDEYRRYILADSALDRRFRAVPIQEPSEEDAVEIMMGLKEKFEIHHGIEISDDAIFSSVFLSKQYIPDKNLPDKAIDLIDEASAALKLSAEAMPAHLVELESEIRSKKIFARSEKSKPELAEEIATLESQYQIERSAWETEVMGLRRVSELKNRRDRLRFDLEQAQNTQNYEEASKIKYSLLPEVEAQLQECASTWRLTKKDIAKVISRQTGIPVEKILKSKQENILGLEDFLKSRVFGQDEAVHEIAETLVAAHAGLTDPSRPLGSFLLLGPSGVGKTETAKALTSFLFGSEDNLIRLDMTEYSEKHAVAKLIGAPAGYVGYEEGGILTEALRRKPYAVVLLDEIEKAHPDFADILLQILDDGRLTDNKGRTVSFRNAIVIMTSNSKHPESEFKPEVLGRIDAMLTYRALDREIMERLIQRELSQLNERLDAKHLTIELDTPLVALLSQRGFDARYGARPLKSLFAKSVTRPLSHHLLKEDLPHGTWRATLGANDQVQFSPV